MIIIHAGPSSFNNYIVATLLKYHEGIVRHQYFARKDKPLWLPIFWYSTGRNGQQGDAEYYQNVKVVLFTDGSYWEFSRRTCILFCLLFLYHFCNTGM